MKKRWICALLAGCLLFTSGCMNSVRLDERVMVQAVGVDRQDEEWRLTLQIFDAAKPEGGMRVVSETGSSFSGILSALAVREGKQMFLGDLRLAVVGDDAAAEGMEAFLNFLNSHYQISPALPLAIAQGSAQELLRLGEKQPSAAAKNLAAMLQNARRAGQSVSGTLMETIAAIRNQHVSAVLPIIALQDAQQGDRPAAEGGGDSLLDQLLGELTEGGAPQNDGANNAAAEPSEEDLPQGAPKKEQEAGVRMAGVGVCMGGRLVQQLDEDTARGLGWLERDTKTVSLAVSDRQIGTVSSLVRVEKRSIVPEATGDNLVLHISLGVRAELLEQDIRTQKPHEQLMSEIERLHELIIGAQIKRTLMISGNQGCDPLGLARFTRQREPEFYRAHKEDWEDIMRGAGYVVEVDCTLE